jgi:hypothetical protein
MEFLDLDHNNFFSGGDSFEIKNLLLSTQYELLLYYEFTGGNVASIIIS